jgi:non-heme chloroperoxidase
VPGGVRPIARLGDFMPANPQGFATLDEAADAVASYLPERPRPNEPEGLRTLVVRGGLSDVVSEKGVREFQEHVPHSEYVNVSDAAHMVAGDRNDAFTAAVAEFLAWVVR